MSILLPPQRARDLVAQRLTGGWRRRDLRFAAERERQLHRVTGAGTHDRDVRPAVGKEPRARAVPLQRPGRRRRREAQRDGVLAPAGKVELRALEAGGIERAGIGERLSGLADGEDAIDAKGALGAAARVVADGVPDTAVIDDALGMEHALAGGAPAVLVVLDGDLAVPFGGGAQPREDLLRAAGRGRGGGHPSRQL